MKGHNSFVAYPSVPKYEKQSAGHPFLMSDVKCKVIKGSVPVKVSGQNCFSLILISLHLRSYKSLNLDFEADLDRLDDLFSSTSLILRPSRSVLSNFSSA